MEMKRKEGTENKANGVALSLACFPLGSRRPDHCIVVVDG